MSEWTPLDDLGRAEAGLLHAMRRSAEAVGRFRQAREDALASVAGLIDALSSGEVDWTDATDEEVREMADALDVIYRVRDSLARLPA